MKWNKCVRNKWRKNSIHEHGNQFIWRCKDVVLDACEMRSIRNGKMGGNNNNNNNAKRMTLFIATQALSGNVCAMHSLIWMDYYQAFHWHSARYPLHLRLFCQHKFLLYFMVIRNAYLFRLFLPFYCNAQRYIIKFV